MAFAAEHGDRHPVIWKRCGAELIQNSLDHSLVLQGLAHTFGIPGSLIIGSLVQILRIYSYLREQSLKLNLVGPGIAGFLSPWVRNHSDREAEIFLQFFLLRHILRHLAEHIIIIP